MNASQSLLFVVLFCLAITLYALLVMKLAVTFMDSETSLVISTVFYLLAGLVWIIPTWGVFRLIRRIKAGSANKA